MDALRNLTPLVQTLPPKPSSPPEPKPNRGAVPQPGILGLAGAPPTSACAHACPPARAGSWSSGDGDGFRCPRIQRDLTRRCACSTLCGRLDSARSSRVRNGAMRETSTRKVRSDLTKIPMKMILLIGPLSLTQVLFGNLVRLFQNTVSSGSGGWKKLFQ